MLNQQINKETLRLYAMVFIPIVFFLYAMVYTGNTAVVAIVVFIAILVGGEYLRNTYGLGGTPEDEPVEETPVRTHRSRSNGKKFDEKHHMTIAEAEKLFREGMDVLDEYLKAGAQLGIHVDGTPMLRAADGTIYKLGLRDFEVVYQPRKREVQQGQQQRVQSAPAYDDYGQPVWG